MSQLRCHQRGGFAGFKSLLFGLLTVGLPGGMGLSEAQKLNLPAATMTHLRPPKTLNLVGAAS